MGWIYRCVKRAFDIGAAVVGITCSAPALVLTAIVLRFTGDHRVLFAQVRIGRNYRPFTIYKFVTMRANSDRQGTITSADDKRVTPIGKILRATKLDELPNSLTF